ncbi:MAG: hypothetical protein HY883_04095 [Deltaproteobacteria bacterium]|nr:hypothetical protein [Deltaproteobacteria bacterium]
MKRKNITMAALVFWLGLSAVPCAVRAASAEENPLKEEMRLLDGAYKTLIDAIALNNPGIIEGPFQEVLDAKPRTEDALKSGNIKLPKNNDKMLMFESLDEEFHRNVKVLMESSKKGDMKMVEMMAHKLLNGCIHCHGNFRQ